MSSQHCEENKQDVCGKRGDLFPMMSRPGSSFGRYFLSQHETCPILLLFAKCNKARSHNENNYHMARSCAEKHCYHKGFS